MRSVIHSASFLRPSQVRGNKVSLSANGRAIFNSISVDPPRVNAATCRSRALAGAAGIAVHRSRAQFKKFELAPLENAGAGPSAIIRPLSCHYPAVTSQVRPT